MYQKIRDEWLTHKAVATKGIMSMLTDHFTPEEKKDNS